MMPDKPAVASLMLSLEGERLPCMLSLTDSDGQQHSFVLTKAAVRLLAAKAADIHQRMSADAR